MTPCRLIHGTTLHPSPLWINALQRILIRNRNANSAKIKVKLDHMRNTRRVVQAAAGY